MFHFPAFPPHTLYIQMRVTRHHSCWVSPFGHPRITRSVDSSPRHIAASHVLHRLLVPRHPPCALKHLQHKKPKIRVKKSEIAHQQHNTPHQPPKGTHAHLRARCSQPLSTNQTPHPTTKAERQPTTTIPPGMTPPLRFRHRRRNDGPVVSKPNSVSDDHHRRPKNVRDRHSVCCCTRTDTHYRRRSISTNRSDHRNSAHMWAGPSLVVLLRKEVIQPHLPVRLPCYDFVPIADPTFDGSLPQGVRPPASGVTDFHDVTGGVYKARERIHRSVADLRLLATPTSRGRVADPDPN